MVELSRKFAANRRDQYSPIVSNHKPLRHPQPNMSVRCSNEFFKSKPYPYTKPNVGPIKYGKKLPISFVASRDWKLYIHFSHKVRIKGQFKPKDRVGRLINSFLRLYQEYAYVCDNILPTQSLQIESSNIQRPTDEHRQPFDESDRESQISKNIFEGSNFGRFSDPTKGYHNYNSSRLRRWVINQCRHFRPRKFNYTVPYDKIRPYQHETIEIYSNEKMQNLISHRISFTGFDSMGRPTIKWIQVPIALELLIPKVQSKIRRIMTSCTFLFDPLEVAAELRYFNYNVDMCIAHFHRTRKFRDILEEFLPQQSQLKDLESNPQLWQNFQTFLEHFSNDKVVNLPVGKIETLETGHNIANCNSGPHIQGDHQTKKRYDNPIKTECSNTLVHSKLIKMVCTIEKLKLSNVDIRSLFEKWKSKYNKQIVEYSKMMIHIIESFKEFLMTDEQRGRVLHLLKQNDELKLKLKEEEKKRKTIYNMMQDQLGNVRVYCRCRALERHQNVLDVKTNDTVMVQIGFCEEYKFDKVFEPFRTQSDIYEELQPLIMSFIDGFNVCFITYGGEASGKTYTLLGPLLTACGSAEIDKHDGIMKRALREVLSEETTRRRDWEYHLTGSIVEIYNDSYTDLLAEKTGIHLPIDGGLEKVQETLKSMSINCEGDIDSLIKVCKVKRKVGRTALNPHSSRSHLITMIHLTGRSKIHGESISSFLGLCDLAGFEDILKAETHNNHTLSKEAGYINKSLTAFNRMFTSLRRQDPNSVSYRDTKLTYLLKPFLTNQGKCILIVTVRTDKSSISSTQSTLRFGRESRGVALGKAKRQTNLDKVIF